MKRSLLALLAAALSTAACGVPLDVGNDPDAGMTATADAGTQPTNQNNVTNSVVTLGGYTLQPRSSAMHPLQFGSVNPDAGNGGMGVVAMISDHGDYCSTFPGCTVPSAQDPAGLHLQIAVIGDVEQKSYPIGYKAGNGVIEFRKSNADGTVAYRLAAESGLVTVTSYVPGARLTGSYDVTMSDGTLLKGTFSADFCYALGLNIPGGGVDCSEQTNTSSCRNTCTCEQKTVRAECVQTGASNYDCTCTAPDGQVTTCSVGNLQGTMSACNAYATCCPMEF